MISPNQQRSNSSKRSFINKTLSTGFEYCRFYYNQLAGSRDDLAEKDLSLEIDSGQVNLPGPHSMIQCRNALTWSGSN